MGCSASSTAASTLSDTASAAKNNFQKDLGKRHAEASSRSSSDRPKNWADERKTLEQSKAGEPKNKAVLSETKMSRKSPLLLPPPGNSRHFCGPRQDRRENHTDRDLPSGLPSVQGSPCNNGRTETPAERCLAVPVKAIDMTGQDFSAQKKDSDVIQGPVDMNASTKILVRQLPPINKPDSTLSYRKLVKDWNNKTKGSRHILSPIDSNSVSEDSKASVSLPALESLTPIPNKTAASSKLCMDDTSGNKIFHSFVSNDVNHVSIDHNHVSIDHNLDERCVNSYQDETPAITQLPSTYFQNLDNGEFQKGPSKCLPERTELSFSDQDHNICHFHHHHHHQYHHHVPRRSSSAPVRSISPGKGMKIKCTDDKVQYVLKTVKSRGETDEIWDDQQDIVIHTDVIVLSEYLERSRKKLLIRMSRNICPGIQPPRSQYQLEGRLHAEKTEANENREKKCKEEKVHFECDSSADE